MRALIGVGIVAASLAQVALASAEEPSAEEPSAEELATIDPDATVDPDTTVIRVALGSGYGMFHDHPYATGELRLGVGTLAGDVGAAYVGATVNAGALTEGLALNSYGVWGGWEFNIDGFHPGIGIQLKGLRVERVTRPGGNTDFGPGGRLWADVDLHKVGQSAVFFGFDGEVNYGLASGVIDGRAGIHLGGRFVVR